MENDDIQNPDIENLSKLDSNSSENDSLNTKEFKLLLKERQQYQALFDLAPVSYILVDRKGRMQNVNLKSLELLCSSRKQLIGQLFYSFLNSLTKVVFKEHLQKAFNTAEQETEELTITTKSGTKYIEIHSTRFNEHLAILAIIDNTLRKQIEIKLQDALKKVDGAETIKTTFLANVSHEMRTPVNAILGFSDILAHKINDEKNKKILDVISSSSQNLLSLFDDVIELSKIVGGQIKLYKGPVAINLLMYQSYKSALQNLRKTGKNNIAVKLEYLLNKEDTIIESDEIKLDQILNHLLNNAIKFTESGSIIIGCEKVIENNEVFIRFYIQDTGIGIPQNKLDVIFNSFRQADESLTRKFEGSGVGLSISKGLIELLGGKINVETEFGKGSEFSFTIPATILEFPDFFDTKVDLRGIKVLMFAGLNSPFPNLCDLLCSCGAEVTFTENLNSAAVFLKEKNFDLVLMIINLYSDSYDGDKILELKNQYSKTAFGAINFLETNNTDNNFDFFFSGNISSNKLLSGIKGNLKVTHKIK